MNILFTCGGTAGHVNPAVALARIFQERNPDCKVLFVGADGGMENHLVPKEGYEIRSVTITNFHRSFAPADIAHNLGTVRNMVRSKQQAARILDEFQPDLVVGTGGYASYPVVKEAARRHIPTAIHESNAVPGLTTKGLSKVVDRVMVGFEESRSHYDHPEKVVVTGTPVRGDFFSYTRQEAREKLGLTDERPLLLSYWGSLGAEVMNRKMSEFIARECYDGAPFHHIHGAGRDYGWMQEEIGRRGLALEGTGIEVREYIYDMPLVWPPPMWCCVGQAPPPSRSSPPSPSPRFWSPPPTSPPTTRRRTPGCWPTRGPRCCCWSGTVWRTPSMTQRTICCGTAAAGMTWSGH